MKSNSEKISVLIPLRNEEENVEECLKCVFNQELSNFEVICLDDNSSDRTLDILYKLSNKYENLLAVKGEELPKGWLGKNWACYQLAQKSSGDYLVFLDADVRLNNKSIISAIQEMKRLNASMLSVFPTQIMKGLGEYLIVPSMNWLLLTFLPLGLVYKLSSPSFVAANGQFIVFKRSDYFKIGGHQSVKDKVVEDMELARLMKSNGLKIVTYLGGSLIFARMYKTINEAINGFSKNFFPGFQLSAFKFILLLSLITFAFLSPFISIFIEKSFFLLVGFILFQKFLVSFLSRQNILLNIFLTPIQLVFVVVIGIRSVVLTKKGELSWKGRKLNFKT